MNGSAGLGTRRQSAVKGAVSGQESLRLRSCALTPRTCGGLTRSIARSVLSGVMVLCAIGCVRLAPVVTAPVAPLRTEPAATGKLSASDRFGHLFCGVLEHLPNRVDWGYCERYFSPAGSSGPVVADLPTTHRVLVIPGIFGQCVEAYARPFEDAILHLKTHHVEVEHVSVAAVGSAEENARTIADYLERQFAGPDQRPYILIGYSKGASDALEMFRSRPETGRHVAALVTIAGSVLGSRATEGIPWGILKALTNAKLGACDFGDTGGVDSLRRSERAKALTSLVLPESLHLYSIPAVSDETTTSAILLPTWRALRVYSLEQDGQMIHEDAIIPGATYLGFAKADHWAVALPFEDVPKTHPELKPAVDHLINRNHFPRVALIEAVLRFVLSELSDGSGS